MVNVNKKLWKDPQVLTGKSTINGPFSSSQSVSLPEGIPFAPSLTASGG